LAEGGAGYSKIVSLGGEIICLLNDLLPNKMILINVDQMFTSPMKILNAPVTNRTAFAVASLNETAFVLMGGYSTDGDLVQELDKDTFISIIEYGRSIPMKSSQVESIVYGIVSGISFLLLITSVLLCVKYRANGLKNEIGAFDIQSNVTDIMLATQKTFSSENSSTNSTKRQTVNSNQSTNYSQISTGHTLSPTNTDISIPGYKKYQYGVDFMVD
jgi:hypothetical protein